MRARTTDGTSLVYSTDPAAGARHVSQAGEASRATEPSASGSRRRDGTATPVSIIRGLPNDREALLALAARLKRACGTGGSAKDGEIIIQGDHRERIAATLARDGLRVKLAGG